MASGLEDVKGGGFPCVVTDDGKFEQAAFGEMALQVSTDDGDGVVLYPFAVGREVVVDDVADANATEAAEFEAHKGVVDAAEFGGGDEDEGVGVLLDVVDGEVGAGDGHIEPAGTFEQDGVVAFEQASGGLVNDFGVDGDMVNFGGKVRGSGVGHDVRAGGAVAVDVLWGNAHDFAVFEDVFGDALAPGLDEFLCDDAHAFCLEGAGNDACRNGFSGIRVDAADEIYCHSVVICFIMVQM